MKLSDYTLYWQVIIWIKLPGGREMRLFAIGDLHLSFGAKVSLEDLREAESTKPMDIFGVDWQRHFEKIAANWQGLIQADDIVLLPGDLSWAMKPEEAVYDLDFVGQLPGRKVLVKGNHDYWWQSVGKVRGMLPAGVFVLQNDYFAAGETAVCGTRGWLCPGETEDLKVYLRELQRLEFSLQSAVRDGYDKLLVMLHYPPAVNGHPDSGFMDLLLRYGVKDCIYGHLHSVGTAGRILTEAQGIRFHLVSCDYIGFAPLLIYKQGLSCQK